MMNIGKTLQTPQGLLKNVDYAATVVNNLDPKQLGRIQARIDVVFDGLLDAHLPWCIPASVNHADGASSTSGTFDVPKIGTKVKIEFQNGSIDHPMYKTYLIDATTIMEEARHNYPMRKVIRLKNNALVVIDTQTNEVFIRNPGNTNVYVEGNLNLTVKGNSVEKVLGNKTTYVKGNLTEIVDGSRNVAVRGNDVATTMGSRSILTHGADGHHAGGNMTRTAPYINDDLPGASLGTVPAAPVLTAWPGIRGNVPT